MNLKTSLHEEHIALKAKMAPFAGFDMPIQYTSVKEEVLAVRNGCGVFDVSHMGEFTVVGKDAFKFVDSLMCNDFIAADPNKAVYSPLLRDNGTVIDDLIAYKMGPEYVMIVVNASNIDKDWAWMNTKTKGFDIKFTNESNHYSLLALQGPKSELILTKLGILPSGEFPYYSVKQARYHGKEITLARTGYTGEDGVEIFCDNTLVKTIWKELLSNGVTPCGLASRDVLRLEVCYPLYGHELNDEITPLDAGLKWTVKLSKPYFHGKEALQNYKPKFKQVKLLVEKGIPRDGYEVTNKNGEVVGKITSGTMSVVLNKGIAFATIDLTKAPVDNCYQVMIRGKAYEAQIQTKPFVNGGHK